MSDNAIDVAQRIPILIGEHSIMLVNFFTKKDFVEEMWSWDLYDGLSPAAAGAKEFVRVISPHASARLLIEMRRELTAELERIDAERGTKHAAVI